LLERVVVGGVGPLTKAAAALRTPWFDSAKKYDATQNLNAQFKYGGNILPLKTWRAILFLVSQHIITNDTPWRLLPARCFFVCEIMG
jgi:hypothetical protein